jgi:hypothetical protein
MGSSSEDVKISARPTIESGKGSSERASVRPSRGRRQMAIDRLGELGKQKWVWIRFNWGKLNFAPRRLAIRSQFDVARLQPADLHRPSHLSGWEFAREAGKAW